MTDADIIVALRRLAESCQDAAQSGADLADRYTTLRAHVMELNDRHGWATGVRLAYETLREMDAP